MLNAFKLFDVDSDIKLFYHGDSMGLFPLDVQEDKELISYLNKTENMQIKNKDEEIENWINSCIDDLPTHSRININENFEPKLQTLVLPIASSCNLKCPYCFAQTSDGGFAYSDYNEESIDNLLMLLKKYNHQTSTTLVFFGGEPLIRYDLIKYTVNKIKEKYNELNIGYSITTNGTLITKERAKFLKENNFAILVSMDGFENEYNYRHFINGKSSVNRVLTNMNLLKEMNVPFQIRATITSDNPYIYETYRFFEELKYPFNIAFAYSSENKSNEKLNIFDEKCIDQIKKAFDKLLKYYTKKIESKEPIFNTLFLSLGDILEYRVHREHVCAAGYTFYTVMSNGDIYTCAHLMNNPEYSMGKISDFVSLNQNSCSSISRSILSIEDCENCWAKYLCVGGCTSQKLTMGIAANKSFPKRQCEVERSVFEFYVKLYYIYKTISSNDNICK